MNKTGLGVLDDIPNQKKRLSYEISKHFEHATGFFSTATSLKFMSNSQKKKTTQLTIKLRV